QLDYYLKTWSLSGPELLAETATSHVYRVVSGDTRVVLKLLTPLGIEENTGAVALRYFGGHGAVKLLRDDGQAHLLEYAEGEDLTALVKRGEDEKATAIIADVLNQLHNASKDTPPDGLIPLKTWFGELFKKAEEDRQNGLHSLYVKAAPIAESLLDNPRDVCVLHGDIHHENIRHSAYRGWLAFDPKGLVGERTYDAANTLCNPISMLALVQNEDRLLKNAGILSQKLGIDLPRILAFVFAYACLSASWSLTDGDDPSHALKIAEIVEPYILRFNE
ncbi:MAG: aminoglycoside phosphotransferase family protein, partial [Aggregatilineales bacterium]